MYFSWFAWNDIEKNGWSLHRCILNVFGISAVGTATRNFMQNAPGCMSPWLGSMASRWSSAKTKHFAWLGNYRGQLQISQYRNTDFTIFGGNTSINPSYFGVKTKGLHGFWPSKFWPFWIVIGVLKGRPNTRVWEQKGSNINKSTRSSGFFWQILCRTISCMSTCHHCSTETGSKTSSNHLAKG